MEPMKHPTLASIVLPGMPRLRSAVRASAQGALLLLLLLFTACGFPRPPDVGDDGPGDSPAPGITVHVSPSGDDANDGLTQPVKTLKRAIAIAGTNTTITMIALDAGSYRAAMGETFPYTVPANVTIAGPATGGAVLVGSTVEDGLKIDTGGLQDLEMDNFTVAVTVTGRVELAGIHVKNSIRC